MHIILGFLGTLVTALWLLHRLAEMGIGLGGLNPFLWHRRRKWKLKHDANPAFKLESPLDVTALLMTAVAKADGDISSEEKQAILSIFENEFHLSNRDAASLLISSSHLLGNGEEVRNNISAVLAPCIDNFSIDQAESAIELLHRIARLNGTPNDLQNEIINSVASILEKIHAPRGKWE